MSSVPNTTPNACSISARQLAEETLQRYRRGSSLVQPWKVPIERIAASVGARIQYRYGIAHGALLAQQEGYTIVVEKSLPEQRQRYTVAHELAHLLLACRRLALPHGLQVRMTVPIGDEEVETSDEERFCDVFASCLLLPHDACSNLHDWQSLTIKELERVADKHRVSMRALAKLVVDTLPSQGGVLFFRRMGKPADPKDEQLRLDWGYFPRSSRLYLPRFDRVTQEPLLRLANSSDANSWHEHLMYVKLNFGSLRGWRNLRAKKFAQPAEIVAFVFPAEQEEYRLCECMRGG